MTTILERYRELHPRSAALHAQAAGTFPDGVTHDLRYFRPFPVYIDHAAGPRKWDVDGNEITDYVMGHGALLLGHAHPVLRSAVCAQIEKGTHYGGCHQLEVEWAGWIKRLVPSAEVVRFTTTGTEATMMAARLARAYTGRNKLIRFAHNFHGWNDSVTGLTDPEHTQPWSPGVPAGFLDQQIVVPQNGRDELARALADDPDVAAAIIEPTGAHGSAIPIDPDFLPFLRDETRRHGVVLIFDEVVTGFRVSPGGMQAHSGVLPDLTTLAKIVAGGLPGAAVTGRADILSGIAFRGEPDWDVHRRVPHPGTYNANPLSAAAGVAMLNAVADGKPQERAAALARRFCQGVNQLLRQMEIKGCAYTVSSMFHVILGAGCPPPIDGYAWNWQGKPGPTVPETPAPVMMAYKQGMLNRGADFMRIGGMMSAVHQERDVDETLSAIEATLSDMQREELI